jgi:hypothetical protein
MPKTPTRSNDQNYVKQLADEFERLKQKFETQAEEVPTPIRKAFEAVSADDFESTEFANMFER